MTFLQKGVKTMQYQTLFNEMTKSLNYGFFADDVILELAKLRNKRESQHRSKIFTKVVVFFDKALKGLGWFANPQLTDQTVDWSHFFSESVKALPEISTPQMFNDKLNSYKNVAEKIRDNMEVNPYEIEELKNFFFYYSKNELNRTDELLSGQTIFETVL